MRLGFSDTQLQQITAVAETLEVEKRDLLLRRVSSVRCAASFARAH